MKIKTIVVMSSALLSAGAALAATPTERRTERFETRQTSQSARIDAGVAAGTIGPREEAALVRQQASLDRAFDRRAADGRLGARDVRALDSRFDRGAVGIRAAKLRGPAG